MTRHQRDPADVTVARIFWTIKPKPLPIIHAVYVDHLAWCGVRAHTGQVERRGTMDDVSCPLCIGALKVGTPRHERSH